MNLYDGVGVYPDKGAPTEGFTVLLIGIIVRMVLLQVVFILFRVFRLNRDEVFQEFRASFKGSTLIMTGATFGIDVRFFKLIYSNVMDRLNLRLLSEADERKGWRPRRLYMILCMLAIPFDLALIIIAVGLLTKPDAPIRL